MNVVKRNRQITYHPNLKVALLTAVRNWYLYHFFFSSLDYFLVSIFLLIFSSWFSFFSATINCWDFCRYFLGKVVNFMKMNLQNQFILWILIFFVSIQIYGCRVVFRIPWKISKDENKIHFAWFPFGAFHIHRLKFIPFDSTWISIFQYSVLWK